MKKRSIRTERGDINREIEVSNQRLRQLKVRISKVKNWLKEEQASTAFRGRRSVTVSLRRGAYYY